MEILAEQIKRQLKIQNNGMYHCAILEEELQRFWPLNELDRGRKIVQFANDYGLHLTFYRQGMCAIFRKAGRRRCG
jgi:hypothetical protein